MFVAVRGRRVFSKHVPEDQTGSAAVINSLPHFETHPLCNGRRLKTPVQQRKLALKRLCNSNVCRYLSNSLITGPWTGLRQIVARFLDQRTDWVDRHISGSWWESFQCSSADIAQETQHPRVRSFCEIIVCCKFEVSRLRWSVGPPTCWSALI